MIGNIKRQYFTPAFARRVRVALELNENELRDVYHHPSEKRIVEKCIRLYCRKPLTAMHADENEPKSHSPERWLEAYLIQLAKQNNWMLKIANKKYQFLYSQLKFPEEEGKKARPLDLLLYELETKNLIVMELKAERVLAKAKSELDDYVTRIDKIKKEIASVFRLGPVSGVEGYIVWPANENAHKKHHLGSHRLIEYTSPHGIVNNGKLVKPWEKFKELGEDLTIDFSCVKESQIVR